MKTAISSLLFFLHFISLHAQDLHWPDPLIFKDGRRVNAINEWETKRRSELLELFANEMYGHSPDKPLQMMFKVFDTDSKALGGKATRKQVAIFLNGKTDGPRIDVLLYLPNKTKNPVPAILGLNFWGNHSIHSDPGIRLATSWMESNSRNPYVDVSCVVDHRSTEACRGINARQWPIDSILNRGYALVTAYREDIASDEPATKFSTGVHPLYPEFQKQGDNFGTVAAWAWGLSRIMDYLQTDPAIDAKRVALFGWSRLGKAALWAGATDQRFAMVLSNESGAGGAKLFRRGIGENIRRLTTVFPHWFCGNFRKYMDQDTILPFDQHLVISLMAPRPVYIASAENDKGSDPEGEFASAKAADAVYRFLGTDGLPVSTMPPLNVSVQGRIGYHIRPGGHDVLWYDWSQYLRFMDKHFKK